MHFQEFRSQSRRDRYDARRESARQIPVTVATINFGCDENLGYIIRAAACFGCRDVHVIGRIPERNFLKGASGSLVDYVNIISHSNPHDLIEYARLNGIKLVSAELHDKAIELEDYEFNFDQQVCIVLGNENWGVPEEIIHNSDVVMIPMTGVGACLNTAQTGNIILYEYNRQFTNHVRNSEYLRVG
jgi:tRNA G18 (ribose-2'-O)-methylase SpoU